MEKNNKPGGLSKGDKRPWVAGRKATGKVRNRKKTFEFTDAELNRVNKILKKTRLKNSDALLKIFEEF